MAKFQHLISTVAGHVPASLRRGQLATNIPDKIVYAEDPTGIVAPISNGNVGVANASSLLGAHIPVKFHPVAQFGVGMTQAQLTALFNIGTTAILGAVTVFALGRRWYIPPLSCPVSPIGAYLLGVNTVGRAASLNPLTATQANSGVFNEITGNFNMVVYSDSTIYPWFYLPSFQGIPNGTPGDSNGDCSWYRISPVKTFGAIPVSAGFAGAAATSYWGHFP